MTSRKTVGVIGGMGPEATVDFMARVVRRTPATVDQEHVRMIVEHDPGIPDRQHAIRGDGENPGPAMAGRARQLQEAGADFVVMPCNLAHAWESDIRAATDIPFISIISVTVAAALDRSGQDSPVGILTTPGCHAAGLYQQALTALHRPFVEQTFGELETTMQFVNRIKQGDKSAATISAMRQLAQALIDRGARVLLAGCTEFPLVLKASMFDVALISSTDELARATVDLATGTTSFSDYET